MADIGTVDTDLATRARDATLVHGERHQSPRWSVLFDFDDRIVTDELHFVGSMPTYLELAKRGMDVVTLRASEDGSIDLEQYEQAINVGGPEHIQVNLVCSGPRTALLGPGGHSVRRHLEQRFG